MSRIAVASVAVLMFGIGVFLGRLRERHEQREVEYIADSLLVQTVVAQRDTIELTRGQYSACMIMLRNWRD